MDAKHRRLIQDSNEFIKTLKKFHGESEKSAEPEEDTPVGENETPNYPTLSFDFKDLWPSKKKDERAEILTYCEQVYWNTGKLPTEADFRLNFPDVTLDEDFFQSLVEPLTARGLPSYQIADDFREPNFVLAVNLICNVYDKRSIPAKLKTAGLTSSQWRAFLRRPDLAAYYQNCINQIFDEDTKQEAKLQLSRLVSQGDLQAIKHFNEVQNIYRPQSNQTEMVMLYLHSIMEVLAKYVSSEVLNKVAAEIKTIEVKSHEDRPALNP